ncbi:unnamed protein product [Clavelina lepadiformis]|uniref:DNA helicase n=1 Tax=Clavelina lepadiformis TaxID=159417 RepID=A0ABP0FUJ9_CLALP
MTDFVEKQLNLLEVEHLAEIDENNTERANLSVKILQRRGLCIPKLVINSVKTGLYSRTIASFSLRTIDKTFPFNLLSQGDIVKLNYQSQQEENEWSDCNGIVTKTSERQISVAFDGIGNRSFLDNLNQHGNSVALIKVANKVTYERLKKAMKMLDSYSVGPAEHLIEILFGNASPLSGKGPDLTFHNVELNECQRQAVSFALSQRNVAIIHGPPGTGKTTTIIEIIAQLVSSGQKVLACAPSNVAVDNLVEKLTGISMKNPHGKTSSQSKKIKVVRIGHPARILDPKLQELSLDALIARGGAAAIIRDVRSDLERIHLKLSHCRDKSQQQSIRKERKSLLAELRKREKKAIVDVLSPADVVLATNVGAYPGGPVGYLDEGHFDVIVIDECGQALEASCWIPLLRARKCILAGDHLQLSPTIVSHEAAKEGLSLTLLERLIKLHGNLVVRMLTQQYRMHEHIMGWSSHQMYDGKLTAHSSVASHLLSDMPNVISTDDTKIPMLLIDTDGCDMNEAESEESDSRANEGEVKIVYFHVMGLIDAGVAPSDIAVVSPYNLQVDILRKLFRETYPQLEIKSVDGFQGREKEAVVLTLVRSNGQGEVGFLSDKRRLNVAVTRARRHLAVICDSGTVCQDDFIKTLVDYINEHGEVRTGFEYAHLKEKEAFDVLASFHLNTAAAVEASKPSLKLANNNTNPTTTKKIEKKAFYKKSDSTSSAVTPLPPHRIDFDELIEEYRKILIKYKNFFSKNEQQSKIEKDNDLSSALDITVSGDNQEITFPACLTAAERKAVHTICEEMGLTHVSMDEGMSRRISVGYKSSKDVVTNKDHLDVGDMKKLSLVKEVLSNEEVSIRRNDLEETHHFENLLNPGAKSKSDKLLPSPNTKLAMCEKCGKELPKDNLQIHLLHCERIMRLKQRTKHEVIKPSSAKPSKVDKAKKKNQRTSQKKESQSNDFDKLINEAMSSNRACQHDNCTFNVTTTGQLCTICKRMFCLKHCVPEAHGCGNQARANARRQISKDGILYSGSGVPDRKLPAEKRTFIKNKLSSKIKDMEDSRKITKKSKDTR